MAEGSDRGASPWRHPVVVSAIIAGIFGVLTALITVGAFNGWFSGSPVASTPLDRPAPLPPDPAQLPDPGQSLPPPPSQFPLTPPAVPGKG